ncbi:MAG: rRNA adenine dimethyltransferase family protein, partial [Chlamydiota bacterium]
MSQNFLIDQNIVHKILRIADVQPGDSVLEIGPGPGALTSALLEAGAHVFAVELDNLFADQLLRLQTADQRLHVFNADFLEFPLSCLPPSLKVVANLPYHITAPILEKIFNSAPLFSTLTIMVQKEVAERMAAVA